MTLHRNNLLVATTGRGFYDVSKEIRRWIADQQVSDGLLHLFLHHTSASMVIMENADPDVLVDLETFMADLVRDGDPRFRHVDEGPDDMSAHVRSALTHTDLMIPVSDGQLDLGTWQGIFLWEHRTAPHRRRISLSLIG